MADIFEKELNNFFNKVFKSKINWITKIQEDIEKLIDTYPKLYEEKLRSINDRYEDELKELEVDLNHGKLFKLIKLIKHQKYFITFTTTFIIS